MRTEREGRERGGTQGSEDWRKKDEKRGHDLKMGGGSANTKKNALGAQKGNKETEVLFVCVCVCAQSVYEKNPN